MADEAEGHVLFTIGYEGRTPANLVRTLRGSGVRRLVDVRLQPSSRVKGFSLMALFESLRQAGITYEHIKELGNPPEIRQLFHQGELKEGRRQYRRFLENGYGLAVDVLVGLVAIEPTAILCRERDAKDCHRSVVAEVAATRSGGAIRVIDL
jgi:uncharacterized protein (DUF488 family)